jgi:hypothetical protein
MRLFRSLTTASFFVALGTGCSYGASPVVSSVLIYNISEHPVSVMCTVNPYNIQFYNQPGVLVRYLDIKSDDAPDIDLQELRDNLPGEEADLRCVNTANPTADWFGYTFSASDESAVVSGHFHYDRSYPGSFTFENN